MEIDRTFVIFDCKPNGSNLFFGGALVLSQTLGDTLASGNIDFERNYTWIHSLLNNRMWMVHDKVNCERLTYGCNQIGKPPPTPTSVIDTSLFTSSRTKLGRAAVMFGLGNGPNGYESNLSAILACTEIMSKLDVPVKTLNDTVHPMIYYLMQYNDKMNDEVRARYFNKAEYPSLNKIDDIPIKMLVDDVLTTRKADDDDDDDDDDEVKEETWKPSKEGFLKYLVDSKLVFDTIERIVDESENVSYAYFRRTGLERCESLEKDLQWFRGQDLVIPEPSNIGVSYAKYLEEQAGESAPLFLSHFYSIYFSHIAGGQVIVRQVSEKLLEGKELEFNRWEGDAQELLKGVREKLNVLGEHWTRDEKNKCLKETAKAFKYMGQIVRLIIL